MQIKLKKEALDSGGLCSTSSHQGFSKGVWNSLNNGETVEVDSIPTICKDKIEEVVKVNYKPSSQKKGGK